MFIRKNNVIYSLNLYAKIYPNVETCALCLAHLDDDFDAVYFNSKEELLDAFDTITRYFNAPVGMSADQIPDMLNLDGSSLLPVPILEIILIFLLIHSLITAFFTLTVSQASTKKAIS